MSFRDHATAQTTELVAHLAGQWSEHSKRELETLRAALDAAAQATGAALASVGRETTEPALTGAIEKLSAAAQSEVEAVAARVSADGVKKLEALRKELQGKANELAKAGEALEAARAETGTFKAQLRAQTGETDGVRAELARVQETSRALEQSRGELQKRLEQEQHESEIRLRAVHDEAERMLKEAQDAAQALLEETQQQVVTVAAHAEQEKATLEKQLADMDAALEQTRSESSDITRQLETEAAERAKLAAVLGRAQSQGQNADAERRKTAEQLESARARVQALESAQHEWEQAKADLEQQMQRLVLQGAEGSADVDLSKFTSQPLDRLLNAFQKLEQSRSVHDVLTAIVDGLAGEFARVAAFEVSGNHLQRLRQLGFESERDMSKVMIPLSMESLLTEAVATGRIQSLAGASLADGSRTLFGGEPSFILALPIAVGGEVIAVVYADDDSERGPRETFPQNQVKFAQLLLWHAVPRLPRLVREERERTELQEYAAHLIRQLQEMHDADAKGGRKGDDLTRCLAENLKCARDMFTSRAEVLDDADALFDESLSAVLDDARSTPFARDLAVASGRTATTRQRGKARQVS